MLLTGKVVLVTGAASGIGRAILTASAQEGARVVGIDINADAGMAAIDDLDSVDALFLRADVGQPDEVEAAVATTLERFGRIDVLHSNAASYDVGSATETTEAQWDRTLAVCLKATWALAHFAVPTMVRTGGGAVVIISSVHAVQGYRRHAAYQAAKGGLVALTRSLAVDYAPGVRVNCVLPGPIVTGLWKNIPDHERSELATRVPLRRNGTPDDVANVAVFLSSSKAGFMTGTTVTVDGGLTAIAQGE